MKKLVRYCIAPLFLISLLCMGFTQPKPKSKEKIYFVEISTRYGTIKLQLYNQTPEHRDNFIKLAQSGFYDSLLFHRVIREFMIQGGDPDSKYAKPDQQLGAGDVGYRIPPEFVPGLYHKRGALAAARDDNPQKASSGCQFYIVQGRKFTLEELSMITNQINYGRKSQLLNEVLKSDSAKARIDDFKTRGDQEGLTNYVKGLQPIIDKDFEKLEYRMSPDQVRDYTTIGGTPHLDQTYTVFGQVISGMEVVDSIASVKTNAMSRPLEDVRMKVRVVTK